MTSLATRVPISFEDSIITKIFGRDLGSFGFRIIALFDQELKVSRRFFVFQNFFNHIMLLVVVVPVQRNARCQLADRDEIVKLVSGAIN